MMADSDISKDWPTLSDSNGACASAVKNKHGEIAKERPKSGDSSNISATNGKKNASDVKTDATDGSYAASSTSTNSTNTGARRKKQTGKTKWSSVPINFPSYRDNKSDRNYNESHKFYGVNNNRRFNNYESANNYANGHESSRGGRPFRGGRGGRGGQFRSRRENNVNSNSPRYQAVSQDSRSTLSPVEQQVDSTQNESVTFSEAITEQVMRQIEYYFSEKNLYRDTYLRFHMDEQGYADLTFMAEFPRMKRLTGNLQLILEAVKKSSHLEVSDDVKVRPVVDPLRWPLKSDVVCEANSVNASEPFVDLISAQMYNMSLNPNLYPHIPGTKSPYELPWQYIPEQEENDALYCVYPTVDSNGFSVAPINADIPNGHISPSEPLDSPNSVELNCELTSQYVPNRYELKNGTIVCPVTELPIHVDSNGVATDGITVPNGQDEVISQTNGEASSSDLTAKTIHHSSNGCIDADSIEDAILSSACHCSEEAHDVTYVTGSDRFNPYLGQMSNGVLLYNSGGHYYVPHSAENNADSSDEKSTLQNKSPEPSR